MGRSPMAHGTPVAHPAVGGVPGLGRRTRLESVEMEATILSELEERGFGCVHQQEPSDIDGIAARSGLEVSLVSSALLQLELKHLVQQLPGNRYIRYIEVG